MAIRTAKQTESTYEKRHKIGIINLGDKGDSELEEDGTSQLPDNILITILSQLSTREAARTCVVSKRWRYLWTHVTCLNFDDVDALSKPWKESIQHTTWQLNQCLQLHQGSTLVEFRIRSSLLDCSSSSEIDNWIEFAKRKRVQRLEIDLKGNKRFGSTPDSFIFSDKPFKSPFFVSSIKSLTHLTLTFVNITSEQVEHFLSNFQFLEHLCVSGSARLVNLKAAGSSLRLKFLQISDCLNLSRVEISAPNLMSFIYGGIRNYEGGILLEHAPSLVNVSLAEKADCITKAFQPISTYFPQLETLHLHMNLTWNMVELPEFPELTSLKELSLSVIANDKLSLLDLTSLIERSPSLHGFTLKLRWRSVLGKHPRNMRKVNKCPHQCLKVVKFSGFVGSIIDTELAMYLIENAVGLEKVVIDLERVISEDSNILAEFVTTEEKFGAMRKRALQLVTELPPAAELIII